MNTKIKNLIQDFVVMIVLIALIIVYSIKNLDWRTSEALYIGSEWINFFIAVIAKVPVYAFGMYACLCLFVIAKEKENKKARIVFMAIYALGAIICGMLGLQDFVEALISNFIDSTILTYIIAAVLACGIFYPVYLYVNKFHGNLIL